MSFSSDIKKQIIRSGPESDCCMRAEAYGLLLFSRLSTGGTYSTSHSELAHFAAELIAVGCGIFVNVEEHQSDGNGKKTFSVALPFSQADTALRMFAISREGGNVIDRSFVENDCCRDAFLRGAFLACGTITDPDKGYHMEFAGRERALCLSLQTLLADSGIKSGVSERGRSSSLYIKSSEDIEQTLADLGAGDAYYEFVNLTIYRQMRNKANRAANCDGANIAKTVTAAQQQIEAIRLIERRDGLASLPADLRELAELRLENPEMTLRDLGAALSVPLSRSGVNHRLQRLLEIAGTSGGEQEGEK